MPETNFFWDPVEDNIIQERDETGAVTAEYATEPYLYGNLISQNRGGVESQYHFDSQGSTLALTDDNQNVTDTYAYSAFGEVTAHTGSTVNPFQYIGQDGYYRDAVTSECRIRRRSLLSGIGQWISRDPLAIAIALSPHIYIYANNNPTSYADPSGLLPPTLIATNSSSCPFSGTTGDIEWTLAIDADRSNVLPPELGFRPFRPELGTEASDPRYVGVWAGFVDTKRGKNCGTNGQGVRVWVSAKYVEQFSILADEVQMVKNQSGLEVWEYDHITRKTTDTIFVPTLHLNQSVPTPTYWDFPGVILGSVKGIEYYVAMRKAYSVAILCVCPEETGKVLNDGKPLAQFDYTVAVTEHVREPNVSNATVSFRVNNTWGGGVKNWIKMRDRGVEANFKIVKDCC